MNAPMPDKPSQNLFLGLIALIACGSVLAESDPRLSGLQIANGKVEIDLSGPAGEYKVQASSSLQAEDWVQLSRRATNGSAQRFDDPLDLTVGRRFYRLEVVPSADEFHLNGPFAVALVEALDYGNLQVTFGLDFAANEAVIPAGNTLSFSSRNSRIYSAVIAALSKLAQDISDSFAEEDRPSAATIAAAIAEDLEDFNLDGRNNGIPVAIEDTGFVLPEYLASDFLAALDEVKEAIPGLYNVFFTSDGSEVVSSMAIVDFAFASQSTSGGMFTAFASAMWGDFYWDSSDWQ